MTITRSGIIRQAPLTMRLRANSVWHMLEFVFNGMVFLMLGLQLPSILENSIQQANADPNVDIWMIFADIALVYAALMVVRFGWLWIMQRFSKRLLKNKPLVFSSYSLRELLIASFAGVRGAITLAGVLSIPLFLSNGNPFPARYELVFIATGVILFSLLVGVIVLPVLLRGVETMDKSAHRHELQHARAVMAGVAIESLQKMEARLEKETDENIDPELLKEVSLRVIGNLRRRAEGKKRPRARAVCREPGTSLPFERTACRTCRSVSPACHPADIQRNDAKIVARSGPAGSASDRERRVNSLLRRARPVTCVLRRPGGLLH